MHGTTVLPSMMANLTTSLASSALLHREHDCAALNAIVPRARVASVRSSLVHCGLNGPAADGSGSRLSSSHALNEDCGLSKKVLRKRLPVRSQAGTSLEATVEEDAKTRDSVHKVVIVGGGVAGLSVALALHRFGVKVHVLEQSRSIEVAGPSLTIWGNGWRVLEDLGVAEGLRENHVTATGMALLSTKSEKLLRRFEFTDCPGGPHEVRAVERGLMVESLAAKLPAGTIQMGARVRSIKKEQDGPTKVELDDGSVITTTILVGCDGVNSVVGKWMGLPPPRYAGQIGIRGIAEYPDGHDFGTLFVHYLGKGSRGRILPFSPTKVYWVVLIDRSSAGPKVADRSLVKEEVLAELVKDGWPEKIVQLVKDTPLETMERSAVADRWNISGLSPPLVKDGVTLAGDAFHPMTPTLGQGGCTALEDAVVLARTLGAVLSQQGDGDAAQIQKALEEYAAERMQRTLPITVKSYALGKLFSADVGPVAFFGNNFIVPKLVSPLSFLSHTLPVYDAGKLPEYGASSLETMPVGT